MKFKKLICFGDSWTLGVGSNLYLEQRPFEKWDKKTSKIIERKIQKKYSWPTQLSKKLKIDCLNYSETGWSNDKIVNKILDYHELSHKNSKDDLYIIMWSSGLRNNLSFIPNKLKSVSKLGIGYSYKDILKQKEYNLKSFQPYFKVEGNLDDENFLVKKIEPFFKEFTNNIILNDLIDNSYFDFINQMQIYFTQQYLEYFDIKYIMCDAFESMFSYSNKVKDIIDLKNYYQPPNTDNFYDYLQKNYGESHFENYNINKKYKLRGHHPNRNGYSVISELLYQYILKNEY